MMSKLSGSQKALCKHREEEEEDREFSVNFDGGLFSGAITENHMISVITSCQRF